MEEEVKDPKMKLPMSLMLVNGRYRCLYLMEEKRKSGTQISGGKPYVSERPKEVEFEIDVDRLLSGMDDKTRKEFKRQVRKK